jgi:hypothetical protein
MPRLSIAVVTAIALLSAACFHDTYRVSVPADATAATTTCAAECRNDFTTNEDIYYCFKRCPQIDEVEAECAPAERAAEMCYEREVQESTTGAVGIVVAIVMILAVFTADAPDISLGSSHGQ